MTSVRDDAHLDFWFDFASTYSYLTALRIEREAARRGVIVRWRPFLLGPIFAAQGWATSPFNIYESKGRYMVRDISRIAAARGVKFHLPEPFPQPSLTAARVALAIDDPARKIAFSRAVFHSQFADRQQIGEVAVLSKCLDGAGLEAATVLELARSDAVKARLRAETDEARSLGLFGAPTLVTSDGELYWGDDRLEMALDATPKP